MYSERNSIEGPAPGQIAESEKGKEISVEDGRDSPELTTDADEAPDGGARAWLVVLGAWCASFCGYGWINSIGTFQEYYQAGPLKDYSASQIAWIPSMQIFFMSVLGPVIGRIHDRYGIRMLVAVGSFLHVFGLMMASLSTEYYQFMLSQGVCSSIGVASVFICALSTISGWFNKNRGLAFGVLATGSSLGGVVFPVMISNMIRTVGYGWAMRSAAFIILVLLIVANLTLKTRRAPAPTKWTRELVARPFRELPFQLLLIGLFLVPFGLYIPIDYMPVAAIGAGFPKDLAQNLVAFYNAASLVGRLSSGYLSDRLGRFNVFVSACYIAGVLILAMWIPANTEGIVIGFSVLFGLFSGAYISLMGALVAQISPPEEIGYRNGLTFLISAVGGLTTAPIAGAILQTPAGWSGLKTFAGVLLLAGTTGVLLARFSKTGFNPRAIF
ncbi:putative monocarboxylate transporter [Thozetella sp. PMI_491]|nr:putative monocarboxylate transporter [Thozetella sp. PMI_491]